MDLKYRHQQNQRDNSHKAHGFISSSMKSSNEFFQRHSGLTKYTHQIAAIDLFLVWHDASDQTFSQHYMTPTLSYNYKSETF